MLDTLRITEKKPTDYLWLYYLSRGWSQESFCSVVGTVTNPISVFLSTLPIGPYQAKVAHLLSSKSPSRMKPANPST